MHIFLTLSDQVTQTDVTTSDEFAQTSQECKTSNAPPSADATTNTEECAIQLPQPAVPAPPVEKSEGECVNVATELPATSSDRQIVTDSADISCKKPCTAISPENTNAPMQTSKNSNRDLKDKSVNDGKKREAKSSETKQRLGRESQVKYLASLIKSDLDDDDIINSQELEEALHSRLKKKVVLLNRDKDVIPILSILSSKVPKNNSPARNRIRPCLELLSSTCATKSGKTGQSSASPKTTKLERSKSIWQSLSATKSRPGNLESPLSELSTTPGKSLTKPEPIYAVSKQSLHSVPMDTLPVISVPSIVVGSKDNSAFSSVTVSRKMQTWGISAPESSPKVTLGIKLGTGSLQVASPKCSVSSEPLSIGKRKYMALGAGDASDLNGKMSPLARGDKVRERPTAGTSGILLGRYGCRRRLMSGPNPTYYTGCFKNVPPRLLGTRFTIAISCFEPGPQSFT
jgi:hypothetical protein